MRARRSILVGAATLALGLGAVGAVRAHPKPGKPANTVHVVLSFKAKPDKVDALKKLLGGLVKTTQAEPGCLMYDLFQNSADPTNLAYIEEWTTKAALDTHRKTAHVKAALAALGPLIAEPPDDRFYQKSH